MKKLKFFAGAILAAMALTVYVSAGTTQADAGVLLLRTEALTDCEASIDCPDGTKAKCETDGQYAVCGSGEHEGKLKVVCISGGQRKEDSCD